MKREKSKTMIALKFFAMMVVSALGGAVVGYNAVAHREKIGTVLEQGQAWLLANAGWFMLLAYGFFVGGVCYYMSGKRYAAKVRSADDAESLAFSLADRQYGISLSLCMTFRILLFSSFGLTSAGLMQASNAITMPIIVQLVLLFVGLAAMVILQGAVVKATKDLYPEKRGNILDTKFLKDWYGSCDEAERAMIGQAAYSSFKAMSQVFPAAFLACVIIGFVLPLGVMPMILVAVLWLIQTNSYMAAARRIEDERHLK